MHVCIFGASSSIGKKLVESYLVDGAEVTAVVHRNYPDINTTDHLRKYLLVTNSMANTGTIDIAVILNGSVSNSKLLNMHDEKWDEVIDSTLTYPFRVIRHIMNHASSTCSVVVVGSVVASLGGIGCSNYVAAKAGLEGLVRAAANEWSRAIDGGKKRRINLLELGYVNAGMGLQLHDLVKEKMLKEIPMGRFAEVEEVIHAIKFLASQTYMTGNTLTFAGGLR
jgi:3-oxoacyl-[acyl-carrier protein] reductase